LKLIRTPSNYSEINLQLNNAKNITPHNIFANDSHEKVEFLLNTVNSGGSKRKPKKSSFLYDYDNPEIIELESHKLDDYLPQHDYDLILLDIEGSEYFAMKGMKDILSNCKTLVVEFLPHHLKNVADIDVETFLSVLPGHFTKFNCQIINKNTTFLKSRQYCRKCMTQTSVRMELYSLLIRS